MRMKSFSIRIDDEMLKKLRIVAANNGRSVNREKKIRTRCKKRADAIRPYADGV